MLFPLTKPLIPCILESMHPWLRDTLVERWSFTSELSLSCAQLVANDQPRM